MNSKEQMVAQFQNLLNSHDRSDYEKWFEEIANMLMNNFCIKSGENLYRVVECEFYYHNEKNHYDINTHQKDEQLKFCTWYFNDFGLDLTFGSISQNIHAGILIRGIRNINKSISLEKCYHSGPMKVLRELIDNSGSVFNNTGINLIPYDDKFEDNRIYKSIRVNLSKDDNKDKKYRFLVEFNKYHDFKEKENVVLNSGLSKEEQKELLGYSLNDNR
ncbi:MAG: hypothetical protein ACK4IK_05575 [Bacteroidia bacterium]